MRFGVTNPAPTLYTGLDSPHVVRDHSEELILPQSAEVEELQLLGDGFESFQADFGNKGFLRVLLDRPGRHPGLIDCLSFGL